MKLYRNRARQLKQRGSELVCLRVKLKYSKRSFKNKDRIN